MGTWKPSQRKKFIATMRAKKNGAKISEPPKSKLIVRFSREQDDELRIIADIITLHRKLSQAGINYLKSRL